MVTFFLELYTEEDLTVHMAPLAKWCHADYVEQRITKVVGNENRIVLEDGSSINYDVLVLNVGSKTRGTTGEHAVGGVWENSLTTRPINDLLPKIRNKEEDLQSKGITPEVLICGAGAAGTELAFGFKHRWNKVFEKEIKVTLIANADTVLKGAHESTVKQVTRKLNEANIHVEYNCKVKQIDEDGVQLADGRKIIGNVPVWATGAEAQMVSAESDIELLDGYFRVNDFMQSTSHPNVFAGGDCVTMETYAKEHFPPKAGVYAVRAGPFIAQNVSRYLRGEEMLKYVPQREFLSLLMTGDERAIGAKFGITFVGRWVWLMKDYIDMSFMDLFNANYLFEDFKNLGTTKPIEANELFEQETKKEADKLIPIRARAA
jgi:NADH dehydrogenase FAD-containing subunit